MAAGRKNASQVKARNTRKVVIFTVEIVVILVMLVVLWKLVASGSSEIEGPSRIELFKPEEVGISNEIQEKKETGEIALKGYLNIALFGVDAKTKNELYSGSRSDSMMIASVNMDTGEIKLVSVYRDTLLNVINDQLKPVTKSTAKATAAPSPEASAVPASRVTSNDPYRKCNSAYVYGGAQQALQMLNMNLDMDIQTFVTVGYKGLSKVIDGLGGVWIDVDSDELLHINNYQIDIAEVLKCDYVPVKSTGYQKLNGVQAAAYCRIRYTTGNDFARAGRQREVLKAIEKEAKNIKDWNKLWDLFTACSDDIYTNVTNDQILDLLKNITKYSIVDEDGFPQADMRTVANIDVLRNREVGSAVVATSLESNVVWLHKFLFGDENYTVTKTVSDISKTIATETKPFLEQK